MFQQPIFFSEKQNVRLSDRVVVKIKIVSHLRFSLSQSPFSRETWDKILSPIFRNTLNMGATKLRIQVQQMQREHAKNVLKTRLYSNYFTRYSGSQVIRNLFQTFYLHVDCSIWFRYQMIVCAQAKNCQLSFTSFVVTTLVRTYQQWLSITSLKVDVLSHW